MENQEQKSAGSGKKWAGLALGAACAAAAAAVVLVLLTGSGESRQNTGKGQTALPEQFEIAMNDAVSKTLEGVVKVEKTYRLAEDQVPGPRPDPECAGEALTAGELSAVLEEADEKFSLDHMVFSEDTVIEEGSKIRYYLDDSIFCVSWKQIVDNCAYSFSEVKIGHPSQLRRFLSGGSYGSGVLYTASDMAQSVHAVTASSGDYYAYRTSGITIQNGELCKFCGDYLDVCFIDDKGDLLFSKAKSPEIGSEEAVQQYMAEHNIRYGLTFGPILCENGESVCPMNYSLGEANRRFARAAMCQQEPLHYILVTANAEPQYPKYPTVFELARNLAELGVQKAYTLDGGQTATLVTNGEIVNSISYGSERLISDIIYFATAVPEEE